LDEAGFHAIFGLADWQANEVSSTETIVEDDFSPASVTLIEGVKILAERIAAERRSTIVRGGRR